jgi:hypothetical protein
MHGGSAAAMTAKLSALGMPGVSVDIPPNPYPHMTVVWNPLAVGVPDVRGNHFRDYYPGGRYLDAYGNDYYDFGTYAFDRTTELYDAYADKPFVIPEWGMAIDDPNYVRAFADFVRGHPRVRVHQLLQRRRRRAVRSRPQAKEPRRLQAVHRPFDSLTHFGRNAEHLVYLAGSACTSGESSR